MRHSGGVGERRKLIERYPLYFGGRHPPGEQCVSAPTYQGAARGQLLGELWVVFSFGVKFTSLIKVIYFLVNKVFLDQFRLFFDNSFFPRSLAQAMLCSMVPS